MKSVRWRLAPLLLTGSVVLVAGVLLAARVSVNRAVSRAQENPDRTPAADLHDAVNSGLLLPAVMGLLAGGALALFLASRLSRPLTRLRANTQRRARGERPAVPVRTPIHEIQALAHAIDRMADDAANQLQALTHERNQLALLVNFVSEGILQIAPDGRIVHANPAARRLLGIPADAAGQPLTNLVRQAELRGLLDRSLAGTGLGATEIAVDDRRLLVSARPIDPAPDAENPGTVIAFIDLTEVRRLEGVRRDFVANVSHELKTPLTSIRGYVETLLTDDLSPEMQRQFLDVIQANAERIQSIVDDLLDLSRLESGGWRPELRPVDPLHLAREVWTSFSARAVRKHIQFTSAGEDTAAIADPGALRQVLSNLYDNALRYTPDGGRVSVHVTPTPAAPRALRSNGRPAAARGVLIEVRDTGSGIPRDALPRIFERFYRVDPARSRAEGGTGLGLSIVKHLMESMGGAVTAESELGKGTSIRLHLASG